MTQGKLVAVWMNSGRVLISLADLDSLVEIDGRQHVRVAGIPGYCDLDLVREINHTDITPVGYDGLINLV